MSALDNGVETAPNAKPPGANREELIATDDAGLNRTTGNIAVPVLADSVPVVKAGGLPMGDEARDIARRAKKRAWSAAYRKANPEKVAAAEKRYRATSPRPEGYLAAWRASRTPEQRAIAAAKKSIKMAAYYKSDKYAAANQKRQTPEAVQQRREAGRTPHARAVANAWRAANAEKVRASNRKASAKPETKARAAASQAARRQTPEGEALRLAQQARRVERYATERQENLKYRMSAAVRACVKDSKSRSKWTELVGYTAEQLRSHLERQFLPKMGWHNFPKWHIDHIVPLSAFRFETVADPEFRAAWALTNLRPIWATDNQRKHAKREFLI